MVSRAPCRNGTGFIGEDIDVLAGSHGRANYPKGSAIAGGGQCSRIAVRQHRLSVGNQGRAVPSNALVNSDVLQTNLDGFRDQPFADFS